MTSLQNGDNMTKFTAREHVSVKSSLLSLINSRVSRNQFILSHSDLFCSDDLWLMLALVSSMIQDLFGIRLCHGPVERFHVNG